MIEDTFEGEHTPECVEIKATKVNEINLMNVIAKIRDAVDKITTINLALTHNQIFNVAKKDLDEKHNDN